MRTSLLAAIYQHVTGQQQANSCSADMLLTLLGDLDRVAKLARLAVDLDAVVKELLKGGRVENVVVDRDRVVNVELVKGLARVLGGGSGLRL